MNKEEEIVEEIWQFVQKISFTKNREDEQKKLYTILIENGFDELEPLKELNKETATKDLGINLGTYNKIVLLLKKTFPPQIEPIQSPSLSKPIDQPNKSNSSNPEESKTTPEKNENLIKEDLINTKESIKTNPLTEESNNVPLSQRINLVGITQNTPSKESFISEEEYKKMSDKERKSLAIKINPEQKNYKKLTFQKLKKAFEMKIHLGSEKISQIQPLRQTGPLDNKTSNQHIQPIKKVKVIKNKEIIFPTLLGKFELKCPQLMMLQNEIKNKEKEYYIGNGNIDMSENLKSMKICILLKRG